VSVRAYPKYQATGLPWLGQVPAHWELRAPKHYVEARAGGILIKGQCAQEPAEGLFPGFSASGQDVWLEEATYQRPGLVLSAVGARCGKTFKADGQWGLVANTGCLLPRLCANRDFLWYLTNNENWWEKGGTAQPFIRVSETLSRSWAFPPLAEQSAIAAFLDRETSKIDALAAEQERLIALLKEKRQAVISQAVTKGLDPNVPMKVSGVEWLGEVPAHWKIKRLKHLSPFITVGIVVNPSNYIAEEGHPFIYGGDIREHSIDWENARRIDANSSNINGKTQLHSGDLLTVRVGAPGVTAVVPKECEGGNCASVMLIRRGGFDSNWLCYVMNTRVVRFQVEVVQYGAAQEQFNISHAVNFLIPTPPRAEQEKIADFLRRETAAFDSLTAEAESAIALLRERRAALISAAVTGKIDVRDLAAAERAAAA
jgi:type I restriction enzyme S subunit